MRIIVFTIFLIYSNNLISQILPFANIQADVAEEIIDTSYIGFQELGKLKLYEYNGKNHLLPVLNSIHFEDKIISLYTNIFNDFQGAFIVCRDLTGSILWVTPFDKRTTNEREFPDRFYINKNKNLEVLSFKNAQGENYTIQWGIANITSRQYDINTGELLKYKENKDESFDKGLSFFITGRTHIFNNLDGDGYDVVYRYTFSDIKNNFIVKRFDKDLIFLKTDTIDTPKKYLKTDAIIKSSEHNSSRYILRHTKEDSNIDLPGPNYDISMDVFNNEWEIVDSIDLRDKLDPAVAYDYLGYTDANHIFVLRNNFGQLGENQKVKVSILNEDFETIESISLPEHYENTTVNCFNLKNRAETIIITKISDKSFGVLKSDGNGNITKQKEIVLKENLLLNVFNTKIVNDKYLILNFLKRQLNSSKKIDEKEDACIFAIFDLEKLEIISSTEENIYQENVILYPNPTNQLLNISGLSEPGTIDIYNQQGTLIEFKTVDNNTIDISHLPSGMYILDIKTKNKSEKHKFIKIE